MTLREALSRARARLLQAGIEDAALEAEVLLRHALGIDRARLFQRLSEALSACQEQAFATLVGRRLLREPAAYISGHREFRGRDFRVSPAVLVPRPETETLVDAAVNWARGREPGRLVDVGTGSGAVGVSLALELPAWQVYATEQSRDALDVARGNARLHGVERRIALRQGDLLSPLDVAVDLIVANLPYVPSAVIDTLQPEVRNYEPRAALDGGPDGLDVIRRLLQQAPAYLARGGCICLECGEAQPTRLSRLAGEAFPGAGIDILADLAGRPRVVRIRA